MVDGADPTDRFESIKGFNELDSFKGFDELEPTKGFNEFDSFKWFNELDSFKGFNESFKWFNEFKSFVRLSNDSSIVSTSCVSAKLSRWSGTNRTSRSDSRFLAARSCSYTSIKSPKKKNVELLIASLHGLVVLFVVREVLLERIQIVLVVNVRVGLQINKQSSNKQNFRSRSDGFPAPCSSQKAPCSWAWDNNTKQLLVAQRIDLLFQLANVGYHLLVSGGGSLLISSSVL